MNVKVSGDPRAGPRPVEAASQPARPMGGAGADHTSVAAVRGGPAAPGPAAAPRRPVDRYCAVARPKPGSSPNSRPAGRRRGLILFPRGGGGKRLRHEATGAGAAVFVVMLRHGPARRSAEWPGRHVSFAAARGCVTAASRQRRPRELMTPGVLLCPIAAGKWAARLQER